MTLPINSANLPTTPTSSVEIGAVHVSPLLSYLNELGSSESARTVLARLDGVAQALGYNLAMDFPWESLTTDHVQAALRRLRDKKLAASTINATLSAIKGVCRHAWRQRKMSQEMYLLIKDTRGVRGEKEPKGRNLETSEIKELLQIVENVWRERNPTLYSRNRAIIGVLYGSGIRRTEITKLTIKDFRPATKHRKVDQLSVRGKGNKERKIPIPSFTVEWINEWLEYRGDEDGPLFCPVLKSGEIIDRALNSQSIYKMVIQLSQLLDEALTPHDFRRSFITRLLELSGGDLKTTANLAGHSNLSTTAIYDLRREKAMNNLVDRFSNSTSF